MPSSLSLENGKLTKAQNERYWRDGYLFPVEVFPTGEAAALRGELEQFESEWLEADLPHPLLQYKRINSNCVLPMAAKMAMDPRVLDVVEGILGPDILIWSAEFFIKEANTTHIVGTHQDLTYWGMGETSDQVTAWIALSPATVQSGCMDFVAGSHRNPILPHNDTFSENNLLSRGQEIAVEVREEDKTHIELQPGQMSLHHGLTIHGSGPNNSDDRRIGFAIRYLNPNARQLRARRDYAMLARGVDRTGNFLHFAPPVGVFSPESLKLFDEIRTARAEALTIGATERVGLYSGENNRPA